MDKRLRIAGIIAAVAFSVIILTSPSEPLPLPAPTTTPESNESVEVLATGLKKPRAIAFGDEKIFVTEKGGTIRVVENDVLLDEPLAVLRTADVFDGGLLGMAAHPDYKENRFLYVYYTHVKEDMLQNKILRITVDGNKLQDAVTILDGIPGSKFGNGGALKFGPDGKLYVGTGSVSDSLRLSQDKNSLAGKILRLNDDGTIPKDNPFEGSPVYTLGHRNVHGLTWDGSGRMYAAETGPSKNDEINLIVSGANYGWPDQECSEDGPYRGAVFCFDPAIEPGGIVFYSGDKLDLDGVLVMASLRASNLYELDADEPGERPHSILGGLGRIRDVNQGLDGFLYVVTSNTDGKGFPDDSDDKLARIVR